MEKTLVLVYSYLYLLADFGFFAIEILSKFCIDSIVVI